MRQKHFVIGLTGTFGSGKSSAGGAFKFLGACVIDCDEIVRGLYRKRGLFLKKVERLLGLKKFDRKRAAKIVFTSLRKRRMLERLIHPLVFREVERQIKKSGKQIVVVEMPLLFESGFYRTTDVNITVTASHNIIQRRLLGKGFSKYDIKNRQSAQWPLSKKVNKADFIIQNNGSKETLKKQVRKTLVNLKNSNHLINDSKRRT